MSSRSQVGPRPYLHSLARFGIVNYPPIPARRGRRPSARTRLSSSHGAFPVKRQFSVPSTFFLSSDGGAFGRPRRPLSSPQPPEAGQGRLYCGRETTDAGLRQMMLFDFQTYSRDTAFPGSIKLTCGRRNRAAAPRSRLRRGGFGWTRPFFSNGISTLLELGSSCRLFISNVVPLASGVLHHRALDDDAGSDVLPEDDEKLSRQGDNGRLLPASAGDTLLEP
jgi:hypothetical protein